MTEEDMATPVSTPDRRKQRSYPMLSQDDLIEWDTASKQSGEKALHNAQPA
jgi:hypothetical protein